MATTAKPQEGGRRPRKTRLLDETFTVPLALSTVDAIDRVRDVRDKYLVHHDDTLIVPRPKEPGMAYTDWLDQETCHAVNEIDSGLRKAIDTLVSTLNGFHEGRIYLHDAHNVSTEVERRVNDARRHMARLAGLRDGLYHAKAKADREADRREGERAIDYDATSKGLGVSPDYVWCSVVGALIEVDADKTGHTECTPEDHLPVYLPKEVLA